MLILETRWSKDSITRISKLGIIKGTSQNTFSPLGRLTRRQMAAMLSRNSQYLE
jgi:S-layer homology domain